MTMTSAKPRYVIINDCDAPQPNMVCQWVENVGYCYLDRSSGKPQHDGMQGFEATPVEAFGFSWTEGGDGTVSFRRSTAPVTATYNDGEPRRWQHRSDGFKHHKLATGAVAAQGVRA